MIVPQDHEQDGAELAALRTEYPQWQIGGGETGLGVVTAERRQGSELRYLVAMDAASLRAKLATASAAGQ